MFMMLLITELKSKFAGESLVWDEYLVVLYCLAAVLQAEILSN